MSGAPSQPAVVDHSPLSTDSTSYQDCISKLNNVLDRHRHLTASKTLHKRERRSTLPMSFGGGRRPVSKQAGVRVYDEDEIGGSSVGEVLSSSSASSLTSSLTDTDKAAAMNKTEGEWRFRKDDLATSRRMPDAASHHRTPFHGGDVKGGVMNTRGLGKARRVAPAPSSLGRTPVLDSLHSINSQLGELLSKVGGVEVGPPAGGSMSVPALHVPQLEEARLKTSSRLVNS